MACTNTCRTEDSARACRRSCGSAARRQTSLLEPDLAGYALMGAQIELLAALGTAERPRL
jgi:hypothetical protein